MCVHWNTSLSLIVQLSKKSNRVSIYDRLESTKVIFKYLNKVPFYQLHKYEKPYIIELLIIIQ